MSPVPNVSSQIGYFPYPIGSERKPYFVKTENGKNDFPVFLQVSLPRLSHRLSYFRSNIQSRYVSIFISAQRWWTPFFGHFIREGLSYVSFEILSLKCC